MYTTSFQKIAQRYSTIFFDSFGVLKNASGIIPGVPEALEGLEKQGKEFIVLTNDSSRGAIKLSSYYQERNIEVFPPECFVSSGMMAREFIEARFSSGLITYIGTEASADYFEGLGVNYQPIRKIIDKRYRIEDLSAIVFLDDEGFDWRTTLNDTLNILRKTSIPVVVANSDVSYPSDEDNVAIAIGSLANMLESMTGKKFMRFGKPDVQIFQSAYEKVCQNNIFEKKHILMVGDTLDTDILGAMKFGIDSALVLTGNTIPDQAEFLIKSKGIEPTYLCESVAS